MRRPVLVATTSCIKMTASFLQAAMVVVCLGAPVHAQSRMGEKPATDGGKISQDLPTVYQRWLEEDVRWIITPEERSAFIQLKNNEDRDRFVEAFWLRRDPTPGTAENEFKEEHYRRLAYANEHFAQAVPGWETDRGRIYILYGPPDEIKVKSARDSGDSVKPTELWHYRWLAEYGKDIDLKFVDVCGCGDFRLETPLPTTPQPLSNLFRVPFWPFPPVCYQIGTYVVEKEEADSDVTRIVGYSTCQPSSKFEVKPADEILKTGPPQ